MMLLGGVLFIVGAMLNTGFLFGLGAMLAIIGVIFWILGAAGRPVAGRRYYY